MHIAFLKIPHKDKEVIPDIPDDCLTKYVFCLRMKFPWLTLCPSEDSTVGGFASNFDSAERRYLKSVCLIASKGGAGALRAALQFALLISPMVLFVPRKLTKKGWNRKHLLDTCLSLGSLKPELVLSIERAVWNTLFKMALGTDDPAGLLMDLVSSLPWSQIDDCRRTDSWERHWFNLMRSPNMESTKSIQGPSDEEEEEPLEEGEIRESSDGGQDGLGTQHRDLLQAEDFQCSDMDLDTNSERDTSDKPKTSSDSPVEMIQSDCEEEHCSDMDLDTKGADNLRDRADNDDETVMSKAASENEPADDDDVGGDATNAVILAKLPSRRLRERIRRFDQLDTRRHPYRYSQPIMRKKRRVTSATIVEEEELYSIQEDEPEEEPVFLGEGTSGNPFQLEEIWEPLDLEEFVSGSKRTVPTIC